MNENLKHNKRTKVCTHCEEVKICEEAEVFEKKAKNSEGEKSKTKKLKAKAVRAEKLKNFRNKIAQLLFPEKIKCVFCNKDIANFDERPYCDECAKTLPFNNKHRCPICDQPIPPEAESCDFCRTTRPKFERAFCPFLYDGNVKKCVLAFKDSGRKYLAPIFAKFIAQRLEREKVKVDVITFVPMTKKKTRKRGYNQSQLLAQELGKILDVPVLSIFQKVKDGKQQKKLSYRLRVVNVVGMYKITPLRSHKNQNLLIVDDILTTCATLNYCATLANPKFKNVYVCGVAREYFRNKSLPKNNPFSINYP